MTVAVLISFSLQYAMILGYAGYIERLYPKVKRR